jgi:Ribonuclease P 40kDa (Rpp40) subunit
VLITYFLCEMVGQIYPFPSWLGHKDFSSIGVLRLELDKESYQRSGLQGQPVPSGGRKHVKARYCMFDWGVCFLESESNHGSD